MANAEQDFFARLTKCASAQSAAPIGDAHTGSSPLAVDLSDEEVTTKIASMSIDEMIQNEHFIAGFEDELSRGFSRICDAVYQSVQ